MKKLFTLMLAVFAMVGMANAKSKTVTLWEDTYSSHIEISKDNLAVGIITVYMSWAGSEGTQIRAYYQKNNANWTESKFTENSGTIKDYEWQNNGTASYQFSIAESDMAILNDNTENTGSRGVLFIGSADAAKMTITKITLTTEVASTSEIELLDNSWTPSSWSWKSFAAQANAKIGDVIKLSYTCTENAYVQIRITDASTNTEFATSAGNIAATSGVYEYEIADAATLELIQAGGFQISGDAFTLTSVKLFSYADSYDAVSAKIGSDGIATFSSTKKLDFSGTEVTAYYASTVSQGTVTLTSTTKTWDYCGYILRGSEGIYTIPVTTGDDFYPSATYLKGQTSEGIVKASQSGDTKYRYIFAKEKNNSETIGFYKLTADHNLAAHKAYLETDGDITPAKSGTRGIILDFGDGTTAILNVIDDGDARQIGKNDGKYYTLQGTSMQTPTRKGLYILNGKKVLVK